MTENLPETEVHTSGPELPSDLKNVWLDQTLPTGFGFHSKFLERLTASDILETEVEQTKPTPTTEGAQAAVDALLAITKRSYSGRHPELGKMVNCKICFTRHRENPKCVEVFVKDKEGNEKSAERLKTRFKRKGRLLPPLNKRALQFVQLVRDFLPDEYTQKDMKNARNKARKILVEKHGRYGYMKPLWRVQKEKNARKAETAAKELGGNQTAQSSETGVQTA